MSSFRVRSLDDKKRWYRRVPLKRCVLTALLFAQPMIKIYCDWKNRQKHERRVFALKRTVVLLLSIFFGLILINAVARAFVAVRELTSTTFTTISGDAPLADLYGHTNILLLGQGDETGEELTDSIIIVSLDPDKTQSAFILSLPRDLFFLNTKRMGKGRVNTFYRDFKRYLQRTENSNENDVSLIVLKELKDEIGRAFNLTIHHAVKIDFEGFIKAIDTIDGIDIDVPYDIIDREYPGPNYTYETFEILKGLQKIDGETALKYARSRSTTSDFARSDRQQQILKALLTKVEVQSLLKNPSRITSLFNIFRDHIKTTFSIREAIGLARITLEIDPHRIITLQLHDRNGLYGEILQPGGFLYTPPRQLFDGASVLLPISVPEFPVTWKQIQTFITMFMNTRTPYIDNPSIYIFNAGSPPESARKLANELIRYGMRVEKVANTPGSKQDISMTNSEYFGNLFSISVQSLPEDLSLQTQPDVILLLGKDFRFSPLQNFVQSSSL
jgi:LCP family protein required for cell wall assembly